MIRFWEDNLWGINPLGITFPSFYAMAFSKGGWMVSIFLRFFKGNRGLVPSFFKAL